MIRADQFSKIIDYDKWQTTRSFFIILESLWGSHMIDRFANNKNTKTTHFNSQFSCPSTEAVHTFSLSCTHDNNFVVPPLTLVCKVIKHMEKCQARGTLVVPYWSKMLKLYRA